MLFCSCAEHILKLSFINILPLNAVNYVVLCLLGHILLSYYCTSIFNFFYDSKFSIFVCHLFRLFIVRCFFRSSFFFSFALSPTPLTYVCFLALFFPISTLFATTIQKLLCMWPMRTIIRAMRLQTVWCCKPLNWLYNYCQDIFQAKIVKMTGAINFVDIE